MAQIESEVKLTVSAGDYRHLLDVGRIVECREQLNIYLHDPGRLQEGLGYFRVRFETGKEPVASLKIPVGWEGDVRRMVEMEEPLQAMGPALYPRPHRRVAVRPHLPTAMARHFLDLGIEELRRLGWMRNRRCFVAFQGAGVAEVDRTILPDGSVQFEVEIETDDGAVRDALVARIRAEAPSARFSELGKFSRFLNVVMVPHSSGWPGLRG